MSKDQNDEKMGQNAAAKYLSIHPNTLANMRNNGKGPNYYRIGTKILYKKTDLDAYLETCRVEH